MNGIFVLISKEDLVDIKKISLFKRQDCYATSCFYLKKQEVFF